MVANRYTFQVDMALDIFSWLVLLFMSRVAASSARRTLLAKTPQRTSGNHLNLSSISWLPGFLRIAPGLR
jgi:hypothetical protein